MSSWLSAWRSRSPHDTGTPVVELLVVAGADAGSQFTLEGEAVLIGRGRPESGQTHVVRLRDSSISRRQAWIRLSENGIFIEHIPAAANATLLNGEEIECEPLIPGDCIEMGRVAIEVRARGGMNLSGLTEIIEDVTRESSITGGMKVGNVKAESTSSFPLSEETTSTGGFGQNVADEVTEVRPMQIQLGELVLMRGAESAHVTRFPIWTGRTLIGRGQDCEVQIPELGISRIHAELAFEGHDLVLFHKSQTNATLVNGLPVLDHTALADGDEIQLADQVVLKLELNHRKSTAVTSGTQGSGLGRQMEAKIDLERRIEQFNVVGSFLDVDIVASRAMKGSLEKAEHIIVSFERFRAFVGQVVQEFDGQVLNSNGDELMCFFGDTLNAVRAASAILARLDDFNANQNLLSVPFRFRIGVHTGVSLVDLDAGIAYSDILDTAGHIQKQAATNGLLISQQTLDALPRALPFEAAGRLEDDDTPVHRLVEFIP